MTTALFVGCGGSESVTEDQPRVYRVRADATEQLKGEAKRIGLAVLQSEGFLDENAKPVRHELVDLSSYDRNYSEARGSFSGGISGEGSGVFLAIVGAGSGSIEGSISGGFSSESGSRTNIRFGWKANRQGQEVVTITEVPISLDSNRIQFIIEEDPAKAHRVSFIFNMDYLNSGSLYDGGVAGLDSDCLYSITGPSPEEVYDAATSCIEENPRDTLTDYLKPHIVRTINIHVTEKEVAELIALLPKNNG